MTRDTLRGDDAHDGAAGPSLPDRRAPSRNKDPRRPDLQFGAENLLGVRVPQTYEVEVRLGDDDFVEAASSGKTPRQQGEREPRRVADVGARQRVAERAGVVPARMEGYSSAVAAGE